MCSTTAAASDAMKNSMGWGRPSSDMNARDWVRAREIPPVLGGARRLVGEVGTATEEVNELRIIHEDFVKRLLTGVDSSLRNCLLACKLDINEIHLQLLVGLHSDQEGRTTSGSDDFIGIVDRLEDECEGPLEFLEYSLDQSCEGDALVWLRVVNVFSEDSNGFGISLRLEIVSSLLQDESEFSGIGDNTIVNNHKLVLGRRSNGMAVTLRRRSVGSPSCVGDRDLRDEVLGRIDVGLCDLLAQANDFAYFLEEEDCFRRIAIDAKTCRVVATVFLSCQSIAQDLKDLFAILGENGGLERVVIGDKPYNVPSLLRSCSKRRFHTYCRVKG